jgi:Domain of unknown function (DUF4232)
VSRPTPLAGLCSTLGLLCAALLAGCGSQHVAATADHSAGTGAKPCRTLALAVTVDATQAGAAAGSTYVPVDFTSTAGAACTLQGYPGISFVTGHPEGGQLGAAAARVQGFPGVRVTLGPGRSAHAWLQVAAAGNYPAAACGPVTAHWLRVYPPGATAAAYLNTTFGACRSAGVPVLAVMPVRAGRASRGSIP